MITLHPILPLKTHEIHEITPALPNWTPLSNCDFTEDTITKALNKIKVNKTPGPDCVAPRILKEAKYQIRKPLAILFNKSGRVLDIWKLANVTPIQKKEDKPLLVNYRLLYSQLYFVFNAFRKWMFSEIHIQLSEVCLYKHQCSSALLRS